MDDLTDPTEENGEGPPAPEENGEGPPAPEVPAAAEKPGRARAFPAFAKIGVRYALVLSIAFFVLYMAGSMYAPGVPDSLLFLLLRLLRYSGFLLSVLSFAAMGFGVHILVYEPGLKSGFRVCRYFLFMLLGAVFAMFSLIIVEMSAGN